MSKQPPPAPTASAVSPCPTLIQINRTPRHWKLTQHHRTTRPPLRLRYFRNVLAKIYLLELNNEWANNVDLDEAAYSDQRVNNEDSDPEVIKLFSCSTQLSMKFFLVINVKMPTTVGILTVMSMKIAPQAYLSLNKAKLLDIFILRSI